MMAPDWKNVDNAAIETIIHYHLSYQHGIVPVFIRG